MARAKAPQPANVLGLVMGGPVVIAHGTDEQKERYLEPILSGEEIWCQGFSEPESGSDLASLKTRAVKSNGDWVVTGQKVWTTFAHEAKWCMLVARTDQDAPKHQGLTYFLMDMEQDAVQVRPLRQITGEAEFNELFIEEARIPDENVVGGVGNGWAVAITTLMHERAGLGAARRRGVQDRAGPADRAGARARRGRRPDHPPAASPSSTIEAEALRLNAWRGLTADHEDRRSRAPRARCPSSSGASVNQGLTELAVDILGEEGAAARLRLDLPLPARPRELDRGRHHRDPQEHRRRARARAAEAGDADELRLLRRPAGDQADRATTSSRRASSPSACASWPRAASYDDAPGRSSASSAGRASSSTRSTAARASASSSW